MPSSSLSSERAALLIQRWWDNVRPMSLAEVREHVAEYWAWEAGEYEECRDCGGNEAFCDCESDRAAMYDQDDLNKMARRAYMRL